MTARAIAQLDNAFTRQRNAFRVAAAPTIEERREHLGALAAAMLSNRKRIQDALSDDFGVHPTQLTDLTEVLGVAGQAQYVIENLALWAAPQERFVDPATYGSATATMRYQPKGVVGVLAPWNFPFLLSLGPLVDILAAGNRAIIKPSELAPASAEVLAEVVSETFDADRVAVTTGGVDVAQYFSSLPWDHLLYTGNAAVGRQVAVAAAQNLVPVTLELGGKNPAIVHEDSIDIGTVSQIIGNKMTKSGQICISPDYCLVPRSGVAEFVELAQTWVAERMPYTSTTDCAGMVSARHLDRIVAMLDEARQHNVEVISLEPGADVNTRTRQVPLTLVIDPPDDLQLMTEEIFGPILPVKTYQSLDGAIDYINSKDRPLALYIFAADEGVAEHVLDTTSSGGACVNTCAIQGVLPSLGFGGSGASGFGRHRGVEGFREFSIARATVIRGHGDLIEAFFPPYSGLAQQVVSTVFGEA